MRGARVSGLRPLPGGALVQIALRASDSMGHFTLGIRAGLVGCLAAVAAVARRARTTATAGAARCKTEPGRHTPTTGTIQEQVAH